MSKKNKVVYSDIQPNTKEAGVWVNTTDGNVMVEKDGKWVDDSGSSSNNEEDIIYAHISQEWEFDNAQVVLASVSDELIIYKEGVPTPSIYKGRYLGNYATIMGCTLAGKINLNGYICGPTSSDTSSMVSKSIKEHIIEAFGNTEIIDYLRESALSKEEFYSFQFA